MLGKRGSVRFLAGLVAALAVLGPLSAVTGPSWAGFLEKIVAQFQSGGYLMNSVSAGMGLLALGIRETALPRIVSILSLLILIGLFAGRRASHLPETLPRRSLLLLAASFLLPDFDDPLLREAPLLHGLKVLPYLALPALLVGVEYRSIPVTARARRILIGTVTLLGLAVAAEGWRAHTVDRLVRAGETELDRERPAAALAFLQRASFLGPGNAVARMDAGIALVALGRGPEAGRTFAEASEKAPSGRTIRQNYGLWLLGEQRLEAASRELEAIRLLTRARELNPANDGAGRLLDVMGH